MDNQLALHQLPQEIRDKAMIVEQLFLEYGRILASMGYKAEPIYHYQDSVMKLPKTKQTFTFNTRDIVFVLSYYDAHYNVTDRMIVSLHRLPYSGINDFIDLDKLLEKRRIKYDKLMFFAGNYIGNIDEQFQALFHNVMVLLQKNFLLILDGEDWEEGCYPVW